MKSPICLLVFFLLSICTVNAQYGPKKLSFIEKEGLTILNVSEEGGLMGISNSRIELGKSNKQELITALQKSLTWGVINNSKQLSFDKLVAEVSSYFDFENFKRHSGSGSTSVFINVVFRGKSDGTHTVFLYTNVPGMFGKTGFDIERPGSLFWTLNSDQEIRSFISALESESPNINDIFK